MDLCSVKGRATIYYNLLVRIPTQKMTKIPVQTWNKYCQKHDFTVLFETNDATIGYHNSCFYIHCRPHSFIGRSHFYCILFEDYKGCE